MKNHIITGITMICLTLFSACGNDHDHSHGKDSTAHDPEHIYSCPMHPEVQGKEGDKCPKCGMALVHTDTQVNTNVYAMKFDIPAGIVAKQETTLLLTPEIEGKKSEPVPLDVVHDKKIHLIVTSADLSWFEHVHPEYQTNGSYAVKLSFPAGGKYMLFADYTPSGAQQQLNKTEISVSGDAAKTQSYSAATLSWKKNNIEASIGAENGEYVTGRELHIAGIIKENGKPVDAATLDNYLGAKAHMVLLKAGSYEYIHVHPDVEDGHLDLHAYFDTPGIYRGWLQFQLNGTVHTADFVIDVKQGEAPKSGHESQDGHGHDHAH